MIIKSIELDNIRSYKHDKIEFEEGINFISGDIGSGKSSILQAIEFCLFGFKKGDLEAFQLLRKGEEKASIKLILIDNKNNLIEICRNLKSGKSGISQVSGYVKNGDDLIELSAQELNAYVFKILNFPKEFLTKDKNLIYRFTIYTPQEQLKEILFTENDKRLEVIRKIFGIDKYKLVVDAVNIYSKKIREDKKVYQTRLEPFKKLNVLVKELEKDNSLCSKKISAYKLKEADFLDKEKKVKAAIVKREEILSKIQDKLISIEKEKSIIDSIKIQKKKIEEKILEIENFLEKNAKNKLKIEKEKLLEMLTTFKNNLEEISRIQKKCESEKTDFEKLNNEKNNLKEKIVLIESKENYIKEFSSTFDYVLTQCQVEDLKNFIKNDEKNLKKFEKLNEDLIKLNENKILFSSKIERIDEDIKKLNEKKANISKLKKCENCLQDVDEEHKFKIKKNLFEEIEVLTEKKEKLLIKIEDIVKKQKDIESKLNEFGDVKTMLVEKQEKLKHLEEKEKSEKKLYDKLQTLKVELVKLNKKQVLEYLKLNENKLENLSKIEKELVVNNKKELEINNKINENKLKLQEVENRIEKFDLKESELKKLKEELKEFDEKLKKESKLEIEFKKNKDENLKYLAEKKKLDGNLEKLFENLKLISNKISAIENQIKMNEKQVLDKNKEIEDLKVVEKKLSKLVDDETFLTQKLVNLMFDIEKQVFTKYYVEFNELFIDIFRELIEDNDIDVRLNSEFTPIIEQNGFDTDIKNLSGGEKASLSIAYRLGLKKVIERSQNSAQKLSLLVLDEPTDGLSEVQVQRFGNVLKSSGINQIIAVSHDEKMESIADNVLKIEKVNHESKII